MRLLLKIFAWFAAALAVVALSVVGINAWDEPLSPQAQALLKPPEIGKPGPDNAWIADIGFHAPLGAEPSEWGSKIIERSRALDQGKAVEFDPDKDPKALRYSGGRAWFDLAKQWPLEAAQSKPEVLRQLLDKNAELYRRYQRVRELPRYAETFLATRPTTPLGMLTATLEGNQLALAKVALAAIEGNFGAAVSELERESSYHRRVLTQSQTLLSRLIAAAMLARDWAMLSDLVRVHGARLRPFRQRLAAIAGPLPVAGLDLQAVFRVEGFNMATTLPGWRRAMWEEDPEVKIFTDLRGQRLFYRIEALGFRPNATVNAFAEWFDLHLRSAAAIYSNPRQIEQIVRSGSRPLGSVDWSPVNPTGKRLLAWFTDGGGYLDYIARMRDISAFGALVRTQMDLMLDPSEPRRANWKFPPEGKSRADDMFDATIHLDPNANLLWFTPIEKSGWSTSIATRYNGRIAVPLNPTK